MKAFVTGATGFIGGHLVRKLRQRGDEVTALVRSPGKASELRDLGCELVEGDLGDQSAIRRGVGGCDACFHVAAVYKVGIPASERPAMFDANVRGTERVLDAAIEGGAQRIVYVSTIGAFGNTRGKVVDERALARAIAEGRIRGAAIDAFEEEPLPMDSPLRKLGDRVLLSPHSASYSEGGELRQGVAWATRSVVTALKGGIPDSVYNREVLPRWKDRFGGASIAVD